MTRSPARHVGSSCLTPRGSTSPLPRLSCSTRGYKCPSTGQVTPIACGSPLVYCPEGTVEPSFMMPGHYGTGDTGGDGLHFAGMAPCTKGTYCSLGFRYDCAAGRFGAQDLLASDVCSGLWCVSDRCGAPPPCARTMICDTGLGTVWLTLVMFISTWPAARRDSIALLAPQQPRSTAVEVRMCSAPPGQAPQSQCKPGFTPPQVPISRAR